MASMENNNKSFNTAEAENENANVDMTIDDTDVDSGCGMVNETKVESLNNEQLLAPLRSLVAQVQEICFTVRSTSKALAELTSAMNDVKSDIKEIKGSLKILEVVVCTNEGATRTNSPTPLKTDAINVGDGILHGEQKIRPGGGSSSSQKRKNFQQPPDSYEDYDLLDLTIENDEIVVPKTSQSIPNSKIREAMPTVKPQLPPSWTQPQGLMKMFNKTPDMFSCRSEFKRVGLTEQHNGDAPTVEVQQIVKKLFQTPSPTQTSSRGRDIIHQQVGSCSRRVTAMTDKLLPLSSKGKAKVGEGRYPSPKIPGNFLPKGLKLKFRPTNDMGLDILDLQVVAYVFFPDQDPGELLVSARDVYASRADFDSLCPGKHVNKTIITLAAEKTRWVQKNLSIHAVWSLPPSFAEDILLGRTINELMGKYAKTWMEPYSTLKYIYVPLKANWDHWFLMVISMPDQVVYHLDSFLNLEDIEPRRQQISSVCEVLSQMIGPDHYGDTFLGRRMDFTLWDIRDARGIPNCGRSDNSAVWLLSWLDMEQYFSPNLIGTLNENNVRMTAVTSLLLGLYNEMRSYLEDRAIMFWETLPH